MKNLSKQVYVMSLFFLLAASFTWAQDWGEEIRLAYGDGISEYPDICKDSSGALHVVWSDSRNGGNDIYFKRSTDEGTTWSADLRGTTSGKAVNPLIRGDSNGTLYVMWVETAPYTIPTIQYSRSIDGGSTWDAPKIVAKEVESSNYVFCVDSCGTIHLAWKAENSNYDEPVILYKRSEDGGSTWSNRVPLSLTRDRVTSICVEPGADGSVYVFYEYRVTSSSQDTQVYVKRSSDRGITWTEAEKQISHSLSYDPQSSIVGGAVVVVWLQGSGSNSDMWAKRSTDHGQTWKGPYTVTKGKLRDPHICVDSQNNLHVVWYRITGTYPALSYDIYYDRSTNGGMNWGTDFQLSDGDGVSAYPIICTDSSDVLHVVWQDDRTGKYEVWYKNSIGGTATVDIKCNGQDSGVNLTTADKCTLTVECQANDMLGTRCDFFIIIQNLSTGAVFTYGPYTSPEWVESPSNQYYTGGLQDLPLTTVLDYRLDSGSYKAYVAIDNRANGVINVPTILYLDEVDFTVTE